MPRSTPAQLRRLLNQLTDVNRKLREENDTLRARLTEAGHAWEFVDKLQALLSALIRGTKDDHEGPSAALAAPVAALEAYGLSVRVMNLLEERCQCRHVRDVLRLMKHGIDDLLRVPNAGPAVIHEVRVALRAYLDEHVEG